MTSEARKSFLGIGISHNKRLKLKAKAFESLNNVSKREEKEQPRLVETN